MKATLTKKTLISIAVLLTWIAAVSLHAQALQIGSRLELFVDNYLVDTLNGDLSLKMHKPQAVPTANPVLGIGRVIKYNGKYMGYYRGGTWPDHMYHAYAESLDGDNWTFPTLDIYPGIVDPTSNTTNIVIHYSTSPTNLYKHFGANFAPVLDTNPNCPADERFKAMAGNETSHLYAMKSADGKNWSLMQSTPVIPMQSGETAFDGDHRPFWSEAEGKYVCYFRKWWWLSGAPTGRIRSVSRATSTDFINWSSPWTDLEPNDISGYEEIYTNGTSPYFRAPHIYTSFPTIFIEPHEDNLTKVLFMTSRSDFSQYDRTFHTTAYGDTDVMCDDDYGVIKNFFVGSVHPTSNTEISTWHVKSGKRYVWRTDGFASLNADSSGGEMVTKLLDFTGERLIVNYKTNSPQGSIRIEIQDSNGDPISNFALSDCIPITDGDEIEGVVSWAQGSDVSSLAGQQVRLKIQMTDADIYSIRFQNPTTEEGEAINFNNYSIDSFSALQDVSGTASVEDGGATLRLTGNTWKKIDFAYTVTADTVIEFDFSSSQQGEIHGFAFETDEAVSAELFFNLYGTQVEGLSDFKNYDVAPGVKHYVIPVGLYYTGAFDRLVFIMDDDASASGESVFSNVRVYEPEPEPEPVEGAIDFNNYSIDSFSTLQDVTPDTYSVEDGGSTLRLTGNTWKKIDFAYTVTADTVIEFDFSSNQQGEIHGFAFETDEAVSAELFFNLYGTQVEGLSDFKNYDVAPGVKHYVIPVGLYYTGAFDRLVFIMDDDASASGESVFSNVSVYEPEPVEGAIDFNSYSIDSFSALQDVSGTASVEDGGATLRLTGNTWKKIDFAYTVTADTVLEFDFSSSQQGEIHGFAFETDEAVSAELFFNLYGTQVEGLSDFKNYDVAPSS